MTRDRRRLAAIAGVGAALLVLVAILAALQPRSVPERRLLTVNGRSQFLAGVNYPWKTYQDFGTGAWGYSGVASPTTRAEIDTDFANMAAQGIKVVKWRIFNDGRYSPEFDGNGHVVGLDDEFFADLDAALDLARRHDLYLVFTLFSSGLWTADCVQQGVHIGGGAATISSPDKRASLVQNAIVPLMQHIGRSDRVLAFEIIAEPEWGISELHAEEDGRIKVRLKDVRALVHSTVQAIHTYTGALATVESNRSSNMLHWRGLGLDYYSFSWYDWLEQWEPLDRPYWQFGLDAPVVLGEFPVGSSKHYTFAQVLHIAYRRGYAGAFAWSYRAEDGFGSFTEQADEYAQWARQRWQEVNVGGRGEPPTGRATLLPPPFALDGVELATAEGELSVTINIQARDGGDYVAKVFVQGLGDAAPAQEQAIEAQLAAREPAPLSATFASLAEGTPYKVSVGLFDGATAELRKWFDGVALLQLRDGRVEKPNLTQVQLENACQPSR